MSIRSGNQKQSCVIEVEVVVVRSGSRARHRVNEQHQRRTRGQLPWKVK